MKQAAVATLAGLGSQDMLRVLDSLSEADRRLLDEHWPAWAHAGQLPPDEAWRTWVLLAGRGFGKTRSGAEWVAQFARACPDASIALIAATIEEARAVMIEGRSGLLAVARAEERAAMRWQPSLRKLTFANGAEAFLYSAANPESLRGPEHHIAWCDELAKWKQARAAWDTMRLGLRLGERPRALVTTTPRVGAALKSILRETGTVLTGGATWANPHLPDDFVAAVEEAHAGTRFGRQELEGLLIEDVEGAVWTRELIERCRVTPLTLPPPGGDGPTFWVNSAPRCSGHAGGMTDPKNSLPQGERGLSRIVVGVDPPASAHGDACGIVVCGLSADPTTRSRQAVGHVLADCSVAGLSPEGWARKVADAAEAWGAQRVIAEKNNGGEMVGSVLRGADVGLPVTLVHAADGKVARAEAVVVLFETGKAKFAGAFPELEDELAGLTYGGRYEGPGRSPDRADAMIWALTELMVKPERAMPRVRTL